MHNTNVHQLMKYQMWFVDSCGGGQVLSKLSKQD